MASNFDPSPWNINKWDVGFRPQLVAMDTATIGGAESFIDSLMKFISDNAIPVIEQSEQAGDKLGSHVGEQTAEIVQGSIDTAAGHTAAINDALARDQQLLDTIENWLLALNAQGLLPAVPIGGGVPDWMQPLAGMPQAVPDTGMGPIVPGLPEQIEPGIPGGALPPFGGPGGALPPFGGPGGPGGALPPFGGPGGALPPFGGPGGALPPLGGPGGALPPFGGPGGPGGALPPFGGPGGPGGPLPPGGSTIPPLGTLDVPQQLPPDQTEIAFDANGNPVFPVPPNGSGIPGGSPVLGNGASNPGGVGGIPSLLDDATSGGMGQQGLGIGSAPNAGLGLPPQSQPIEVVCKCECCPCSCDKSSAAQPATTQPAAPSSLQSQSQSSPAIVKTAFQPGEEPEVDLNEVIRGQNETPPQTQSQSQEVYAPATVPAPVPSAEVVAQSQRAIAAATKKLTDCPKWDYLPKWTDRFVAGRNFLVEFGDILLHATDGSGDFIVVNERILDAILFGLNRRSDLQGALQEYYDRLRNSQPFTGLLRCWITSSHRGWCNEKDKLSQLYAAHDFLKAMADAAGDISMMDVYSDTASLDLGGSIGGTKTATAPGPLKGTAQTGTTGGTTGAGIGHSRHKSWEWRLAIPIKFAIVPLLDLATMAIRYEEQRESIDAGAALQLWMRGFMEEKDCEVIVRAHGHDWQAYSQLAMLEQERIRSNEIIEYARRTDKDDGWVAEQLQQIGWTDPAQRSAVMELYDELPTISEHLEWLRRNVFDPEYIKTFHLDEGFEDRFWKAFGGDLRAQGCMKRTAYLHYCAHWLVPSPGQLAEALQRLRPGRVGQHVEVTEQQYELALAEQDVAPFWRKRFRELAYKPFGLRFIRQLYFDSEIDFDELVQRYEDIGYKHADAILLANSEKKRKARTRATNGHGFTPANCRKLYVQGLITDTEIEKEMIPQGFTKGEVAELIYAAQFDMQIAARRIRIQAIKAAYRHGAIDMVEARAKLSQLHMPPDQVAAICDLLEAMGVMKGAPTPATAAQQKLMAGVHSDVDTIRAAELTLKQLRAEIAVEAKKSKRKTLAHAIAALEAKIQQLYSVAPPATMPPASP